MNEILIGLLPTVKPNDSGIHNFEPIGIIIFRLRRTGRIPKGPTRMAAIPRFDADNRHAVSGGRS